MLEKRYSVKALIGPIDVRVIVLSFGQARLGPNTTARFAGVILFISHLSTTCKEVIENNVEYYYEDEPTKERNSTRYLRTT